MQSQVLSLKKLGFIDNYFVASDATPVFANTKQNNPKSFFNNKFNKSNHPKSDKDCELGVHAASNSHNKKKFDYYWSYKNHILFDAITVLIIDEITLPANIPELSMTIDFLKSTNQWFSLKETYFIADKGYDTKDIHNYVHNKLKGHAFIPLNPRNTKEKQLLNNKNIIRDTGLAMHKDGRQYFNDKIKLIFLFLINPDYGIDSIRLLLSGHHCLDRFRIHPDNKLY